jgi:hypothetical protein
MEMSALWSAGLSAMVGLVVWWIKGQADELRRVQILLNKTREDIARDYVLKSDQQATLSRMMDRFDALDAKLDRMLERK